MSSVEYVSLKKEKYIGTDYRKLNIPEHYKSNIAQVLKTCEEADISSQINQILLFGSCAKQTTHKGSDIDILIITDNQLDSRNKAEFIYLVNSKLIDDIDVDIIFYTVNSYLDGEMPLTKAIKKSNLVLYKRGDKFGI